ncbi:hypothetical protein GQ457_09G000190 [Hibiscus cannabinus]
MSGQQQVGFKNRSGSKQVRFKTGRVQNRSGSKQVGFKTGRVQNRSGKIAYRVGFGCYSNRSDSVPGQHQSVTYRVRVIAASGQTNTENIDVPEEQSILERKHIMKIAELRIL